MGYRGVLPPGEIEETPATMAYFSVADNGRGVPPEARDRIFEPFFSTKETGLGLGLAIARGIVTAHGGRIWVESAPGRGTTFYFTVELAHPNPPAPRPASSAGGA